MLQLQQQKERVLRNNIAIVVVTFEHAENALNYQGEAHLEWPVVVDISKELYSYFGMAKAGFWDLWGYSTWKAYIREILKGNLPKSARDDIHQRGGDVLINPEGIVKLHYISKGPADRPDLEDVFGVVEQENQRELSPKNLEELKN